MNRLSTVFKSITREGRRNGFAYATRWAFERIRLRFIKPLLPIICDSTGADLQRPLTVIVPAIEKDSIVLPECLAGIKKYLQHRNHAVWVVSPESTLIRAIAEKHSCEFVLEDGILPEPARTLATRGWVLQQIIKFNAAFHVPTADYLVLDSDTVFLRPQILFRRGKTVLRYSDQYELLYSRSLYLVFGTTKRFPVSFVTHYMVLNKIIVTELLASLEETLGAPWWRALMSQLDNESMISFSEFEIYGHYIMSSPVWRKKFKLEYWGGVDMPEGNLCELRKLRQNRRLSLNSVSLHRHTQ